MVIQTLKARSIHGILDYGLLMACLEGYKAPHRKITGLLRAGDLIRVKKGLYVLGEAHRTEPVCREMLANLIFGPSYISQEYALQFYDLIPERVELMTSMATKRNKYFATPLGDFAYAYLNQSRFTLGVEWVALREDAHVLMASPEKALADCVAKQTSIKKIADMRVHLLENMRIDETSLLALNQTRLAHIAKVYHNKGVTLLYKAISQGL